MKKVKFIYNPFSGEGIIAQNLDIIIKKYQEYGYLIIPHRITKELKIESFFDNIENVENEFHHILIAGGDGTINQVINCLKSKNINIPIALLPAGTANDFAKFLQMPVDIEASCEKILNGKVQNVDLGKVNDKYFINVFSFGLFTDVSQKTPTHLKNTFGKLAYYFNGIKEIPSFKKIKVKIKTPSLTFKGSGIILFIFNGRTAGNINISYKSEINDGLLDIIFIKGENIKSTLLTLGKFLTKSHLEKHKDILHIKTDSCIIECDDNSLTTDIDGEPGPIFPLNISCIHSGIKIIY